MPYNIGNSVLQLKYGDFNPDIHNTKFMKDRLTTLLPAPLTKGKKRQQFEKRLLVKYEFDTLRESGNLMVKFTVHAWMHALLSIHSFIIVILRSVVNGPTMAQVFMKDQ